MKKRFSFLAGMVALLLTTGASAQSTGAAYFAGKWDVLVKGTPDGDAKMFFVLTKNDTTLSGIVQDSTGAEMTKMTKIDCKPTEITVYFVAQGYDVNVLMTKKDDDHVTGSLMSMFDVTGVRVKATQGQPQGQATEDRSSRR